MKKIAYSSYTKFIAVILIVVCAIFCVNTLIDGIMEYKKSEGPYIYSFESDFSESSYIASLLHIPDNHIWNVYSSYNEEYYSNPRIPEEVSSEEYYSNPRIPEEISSENIVYDNPIVRPIVDEVYNRLEYLNDSDEINYFVQINDRIYTNCNATSKEDLLNERFFVLAERDSEGNTNYDSSVQWRFGYYLDNLELFAEDSITVCTSIKEDYAIRCEKVWNNQAGMVREMFTKGLCLIILALILLIYLIAVSGKKADGEYSLMWIDNLWSEVHLAVMTIPAFFIILVIVMILDALISGHFPMYMAKSITLTLTAIGVLIILTSLLSLVRKIKCKKVIESSVICKLALWAWKVFVRVCRFICRHTKRIFKIITYALSRKTGIFHIVMLLVYTAIIGLCGIFTMETAAAFMFAILVFGFAAFVLAYRAKDLDGIKDGVNEVKNGNLTHKITDIKSEDLKMLANDINDISTGLDNSVAAKLKAEKLKTDLITNVSHDLKTPLTSIISYTELLSNVDNLPEEAKDYVGIIAKKSDRLKNLTQDLFDISKVQSGNENIVMEKLDVALLINQALGEHDSEIKKSELKFFVDTSKELYISADGRKMSRVIGNLISNILKYTLKNTRVFISAFGKDDEVIMEFKNISSYPMEFDADEIIGRFVRGDKSRTAEGNGLGLAIAKSYTEASGGTFNVILDGDMFKAIIKFKKY